jgi:putative transposase
LQPATELAVDLFDNWFDPIETEVRARSRQFIEELIRDELDAALSRPQNCNRYPASGADRDH